MKTSLCLFSLLFFIFACNSPKKAKSADVEKTAIDSTLVSADSSVIPSEYVIVDTIPLVDSVAFEEPKDPLEYMTIEEKGMIDELNLLRADPQAYASFVDDYIQTMVADPSKDAETKRNLMASAGKLIIELQTMEPLPAILPHYKLYQVAKLHGKDMIEMKVIDPIGSDGSHPFQRIREGAELDGTENLIAGHPSMREAILSVLIGEGDDGQNYGRSFLDPQWEFIACYEVGTVGEAKDVWVQLLAYSIEVEEEDSNDDVFINTTEEVEEVVVAAAPVIVLENEVNSQEADYSFMTLEEKEMVEEINLLRSDPKGYIPFVDSYSVKYEKQFSADDEDFKEAVKELKEELENLKPLSQLQPHQELYNVAKAHGLDNKNNNRFEHIGTNNSDPFDRVKRTGLKNYIDEKGYFAPNENLVGGEDTPRESVVALLIDSGVSSRGHRKALLQPKWKYVACYKIGLIENLNELKGQEKDDMNNCWVQFFATD